jgi:hypothetical protein
VGEWGGGAFFICSEFQSSKAPKLQSSKAPNLRKLRNINTILLFLRNTEQGVRRGEIYFLYWTINDLVGLN